MGWEGSNPLSFIVVLSVGEGSEREQCPSIAPFYPHFPTNSPVRLGVFPIVATPAVVHSQLWVCFLFSQPCPQGLPSHLRFSPSASLTGLVGLVDCFFNSLDVRVLCSLIFWHFWLFMDFRLVVILLLVVWGSEGFVFTPPSWSELRFFFKLLFVWNSNLSMFCIFIC